MTHQYFKLREKFIDKGYEREFNYLVSEVQSFKSERIFGLSIVEQIKNYKKAVEKVYGEEWDYWNTWIDYQNYK